MISIIVFLLCLCAAFSAASQYESCDCVPVVNCFPAFTKIKSYYNNDPEKHKAFTQYIKIISCGYDRYVPKVCCPAEIPAEVIEIVENQKYWIKGEEEKSVKKLESAILKAKSSPAQFLKKHYQFPGCGAYEWKEEGPQTAIDDYPWLTLLEYNTPGGQKKLLCGGALISDQHILTAARCLTDQGNTLASVILGEYNTNTNPDCVPDGDNQEPTCADPVRRYDVDRVIIHEKYNDGISHRDFMNDGPGLHDIALIKLKEKVQFTDYIEPICLPSKKPIAQTFKVAGWGRSLVPGNKGFNVKSLSTLSRCQRAAYNRGGIEQIYAKNEHICVEKKDFNEPCIVDSGGPLMGIERRDNGRDRITVFGISFMDMTCENLGLPKDLPGIFTNVYNYRDWIIQHMNW